MVGEEGHAGTLTRKDHGGLHGYNATQEAGALDCATLECGAFSLDVGMNGQSMCRQCLVGEGLESMVQLALSACWLGMNTIAVEANSGLQVH